MDLVLLSTVGWPETLNFLFLARWGRGRFETKYVEFSMVNNIALILTRLKPKVIGLSGAVSGAAMCTPVLYTYYHCTVYSRHSIGDVSLICSATISKRPCHELEFLVGWWWVGV